MRELMAGGAGLLISSGLLLTVAGRAGRRRGSGQPRGRLSRLLTVEAETALATGWDWLTPQRSVLTQLSVALSCALFAVGLTGLVALAAAGLVSGLAIARGVLRIRIGSLRRRRQDEVLEAVRTLRQVLEAGGAGVQQGLQALATRGPVGLRAEFGAIAAGAFTLPALGFEGVTNVRIGRLVELDVDDASEVPAMCERLLSNPLIEDYEVLVMENAQPS